MPKAGRYSPLATDLTARWNNHEKARRSAMDRGEGMTFRILDRTGKLLAERDSIDAALLYSRTTSAARDIVREDGVLMARKATSHGVGRCIWAYVSDENTGPKHLQPRKKRGEV